jgi:uncharacterized membrane protein (DUF106 family)
MDDQNYNETVILPFLERKCRDLLGVNLVLEAKLLAEMEKSKNLQAKTEALQSKIDNMKKSKKKDGATVEALEGETY